MKLESKKCILSIMMILLIGIIVIPNVDAGPPIEVTYTGIVKRFTPIQGATIKLKIYGFVAAATTTDENGNFELRYFRPINPSLEVSHPQYETEEIPVSEYGGYYEITLIPKFSVTYTGIVIGFMDMGNGMYIPIGAVANAQVVLMIMGFPAAATRTDSDGYFVILYFRPVNPSLKASAPFYDSTEIPVSESGGFYVINIISLLLVT